MPLLTLFSDEEELSQTHTLPEPEDPLATCPQDPQSHSLPLLLPHPKLFELNSDEEMLERLQKDSDNESLWDWQLSPPVVQEPTSQHMIQSTQEDHASLESNLLLSQSQPCDTHSQSQQQPLTRPMPPLPPPDPLPSPKPLLLHSVDSCSRPASPSSSQKLHIHREPSSAYYDALKNRTFNSLNEKRSAVIAALQDLALQVVHQLADRVEELHPITSSETGEASSSDADSEASESTSVRRKRRHPSKPRLFAPRRVEPLRIELANRMANNSTPTRRTIAFPRRGRATSSTSGFASAELACLLRLISLIVANLRAKGAAQTKRDLYYADVRLFKSQRTVDSLVDDLAATLGCRRFDLGVVASAKGLMHGALQIRCTGGQIVDAADSTQLIPPKETIDELAYEGCHLVLVVEKEAMFQTLKEALPELGQGVLLICGKGQPDVATRELVCSLAERLDSKVPMVAMVDFDPHGLSIFSTYRNGSTAMSFDSAQLATSRLRLLDYSKLLQPTPILDRHLLPLSQADRRKAVSMLTQSKLQENVSSKLLQLMLHRGYKAETEALNSMAGGMARQVSCLLANEVDFQP